MKYRRMLSIPRTLMKNLPRKRQRIHWLKGDNYHQLCKNNLQGGHIIDRLLDWVMVVVASRIQVSWEVYKIDEVTR